MYKKILLVSFLLVIFSSCDDSDCNDCLEVRSIEVRYLDDSGNNLLFGSSAIFDPTALIIWDKNDQPADYTLNEIRGSIVLPILMSNDYYEIQPTDTVLNILELSLEKIESDKCCGEVTVPNQLILDGSIIPNSNIVTITP